MNIEGKLERQPLKVEIGEASGSDVDDIEEIYKKSWMKTYPNEELGITPAVIRERLSKVYSPDTYPVRQARLDDRPEGEIHLVARVSGKVVGSCRVARPEAIGRSVFAGEDRNELMSLYVHPDYQGQGIGKKLWEEAKQQLNLEKDTVLSVAAYNERAIEFYKKLGFEETDVDLTNERFRFSNGSIIPQRMMLFRARMEEHDRS